ncbi:MAG TPA: organic hydroperoxide resistance protein [Mycobacteriales bacterium]|nr:organic hydroperoxide resistance protein [Mycobacteriales bacterium]
MQIIYTAEATAYGGRTGRVTSDDDHLDVELSIPTDMGGPGGEGTNPEQLFAGSFAACFHAAMKLVARSMSLDAKESTVTARVGLGAAASGVGYGLEAELIVSLPGIADRSVAEDLVEKTHKVCPVSNATHGNIEVKLTVA